MGYDNNEVIENFQVSCKHKLKQKKKKKQEQKGTPTLTPTPAPRFCYYQKNQSTTTDWK